MQEPYGAPLILEVIVKVWFGTTSSGGVRASTRDCFKDGDDGIPVPLIALVVTAVGGWSSQFPGLRHSPTRNKD